MKGRGKHQVVSKDKSGFPRGFTTGDRVRLVQPSGKYAGVHVGRLASIRADGRLDIKAGATTITANYRNFTLIQHGDGYDYAA